MIDDWRFYLGTYILALGLSISLTMLIGTGLGSYLGGALIGGVGGFWLGYAQPRQERK